MPTQNHPDDELLAALAARDTDASADGELRAHVDGCARCGDVVSELMAISAALAELPEVAPPRPLRLLPPVGEPAPVLADRVGDWVRRFFAPVVAAGAAVALIGLVGTAAPAAQDMADSQAMEAGAEPDAGDEGDGQVDTLGAPEAGENAGAAGEESDAVRSSEEQGREWASRDGLPAERSPWPMVLFTGVAVVVGALLLRWILVPRAG